MELQELDTTERLNHHSVYLSIPISHFIPPTNLLVTMFVFYICDSRKHTLDVQWLRFSHLFTESSDESDCMQGSLGNLVHWNKGVRISECRVTGSSNGSRQTKYNMVCIGGSVLIQLWFVQLGRWSLSWVMKHLRLNPNAISSVETELNTVPNLYPDLRVLFTIGFTEHLHNSDGLMEILFAWSP